MITIGILSSIKFLNDNYQTAANIWLENHQFFLHQTLDNPNIPRSSFTFDLPRFSIKHFSVNTHLIFSVRVLPKYFNLELLIRLKIFSFILVLFGKFYRKAFIGFYSVTNSFAFVIGVSFFHQNFKRTQ